MPTITWFQRRWVAISLFANMENVLAAKVTGKIASGWDPNLYFVGYRQGNSMRDMGWAYVRDFLRAAQSWNDDMRNFKTTYAAWHDKGMARWATDKKYYAEEHHPVQLTTIYEVRALTERKAAEEAVHRLVIGDRGYLDWYDASPNKEWSRLLGHPVWSNSQAR
jgi:hypothetical protein